MNENMKKLFSATATPLASIFGSGFLVIVPILNGAVGPYAWLAMACVCGLAYAMGSVIRFNIRNAEPLMEDGSAPHRAIMFKKSLTQTPESDPAACLKSSRPAFILYSYYWRSP